MCGAWEKLLCHFSEHAYLQGVSIDGSVIRGMRVLLGQQTVLQREHLDDSKAVLAVRFARFLMPWACRLNSF